MPQLALDPRDTRYEAVGLNGSQHRPGVRIDLMNGDWRLPAHDRARGVEHFELLSMPIPPEPTPGPVVTLIGTPKAMGALPPNTTSSGGAKEYGGTLASQGP